MSNQGDFFDDKADSASEKKEEKKLSKKDEAPIEVKPQEKVAIKKKVKKSKDKLQTEVTEIQSKRLIRLPLWIGLRKAQQEKVVSVLEDAIVRAS